MSALHLSLAFTLVASIVSNSVTAIPLEDNNIQKRHGGSCHIAKPNPILPNKFRPYEGELLTSSIAAGHTLTAGASIPSGIYNPNGPYYNPHDYVDPPYVWPGKPTAKDQQPPPKPTEAPFPYGGKHGDDYDAPCWIKKGSHGMPPPSLPHSDTNGNSPWGQIDCPPLNGTSNATLCGTMPNTGVTRYYNFRVHYQKIAPDGVTKNGLVINGGFPGPLIEANWGDWIEVKVTNDLPDEGTSLHWHGLLQEGTPWFDGVPSVTQCPIAPGRSLVYRFRADTYGSSWYHSHYSAQYAGGAFGPMIIHGPKTEDYDIDLGPIMLSDWYHADYFTLVNQTMAGRVPPVNNNLINGKMNYPCANTTAACIPNAGVSKFRFKSGKKYRLRLINTSAEATQKFTIDGHTMSVIANDFIPIKPYETKVVTLGVGQRSDVIVTATGRSGDAVWMRANVGPVRGGCSVNDGVSPEAVAIVYYENANSTALPTSKSALTPEILADCGNDPLEKTVPLCPVPLTKEKSVTETIDITFGSNGTNFVWFMNNSSFRGNFNNPVLRGAKNNNFDFPKNTNIHNFGSNSSVRLIVKNHFAFAPHPMHLHGHNFHVLAEGFGEWDGKIVNPANTQRRDVYLLRPAKSATIPSYFVMQWNQDNPGVWPFHCHNAVRTVFSSLKINSR